MIVGLMRVRSLTSATVRPAWWRAAARVSPMGTPGLHCSAAPHRPGSGAWAVLPPSLPAIPLRNLKDALERETSGVWCLSGRPGRGGTAARPASAAKGAREQGAPVAGGGLGEDRFEMVLDGVL